MGKAQLTDGIAVATLTALALTQSPGRTSFDTKLDLVADPLAFLGRAFGAWDPLGGFGQVQNQAYGYLWPMGPFFALGDVLGVPGWVVQGLWAAVLVSLAYLGARMLATALGLTPAAAVAAGLAFAVSPRLLTTLGPISAEALPVALAPWTLLPLVRLPGSERRAAFLSALAVFGMGAANAALTVAVLPLPVIWILVRCRFRMLGWWSLFVGLLSLWWIVPLLVQGRYASGFMDHIETATATTGVVGPLEALRGATHWVAYFVRNGVPWWPSGYSLATGTWQVVATGVVAGVGLVGLSSRRMPARWVWILSLLLGVCLLVIGADAPPGSPVQHAWRWLLDGPLVPFRNIHKFDPLVRLPLALGFGLAAGEAWRWLRTSSAAPARRVTAGLAAGAVAAALAVAAAPLLSGQLREPPGWPEIPPWWSETADFLADQPGEARALLLPASAFGEYEWGRTVDEPLQPLARTRWAQNNQLPLGALGTGRLLDAVNRVIDSGRPSPSLASLLARSGVGFLVVRNDLDAATGAPDPALVHAALEGSAGLWPVAEFGPTVGATDGATSVVTDFGLDPGYPAVEVYKVAGPVPLVDAVEATSVVGVSGGSESLLGLLEANLLASGQATIMATDPGFSEVVDQILTDGLRRRDRAVGRTQGSLGVTQTAGEPSRLDRKAPDLLPHGAPGHLTVAEYHGVADVTASSSLGYADSLLPVDPSRGPFSGVDGNDFTWWQSGNYGGPVGQWLEIRFDHEVSPAGSTIELVDSPAVGPSVTQVRVSTDDGDWLLDVPADSDTVLVPRDLPDTRRLRVTVAEVAGHAGTGFVGIREITVPGVTVTRPLVLPAAATPATQVGGFLMEADTPVRRPCVLVDGTTRCDPTMMRGTEEAQGIDRIVSVEQRWRGTWAAWGTARTGAGVAGLFDPIGPAVRARASSWLGGDPLVRPSAAVDGDPDTAWVADLGDPAPSLTLRLPEPRAVTAVRLELGDAPAMSRPTKVAVTTDAGTVEAPVLMSGTVLLPAGRTDSVTIRIVGWNALTSVQEATGFTAVAPVGVSEVELVGAQDLVYAPDLQAPSGALCGFGPGLAVDGVTYRTRVTGTLQDILDGSPLRILPCGRHDLLTLDPGRHRVRLAASDTFLPTGLAMTDHAAAPVPQRSVQVLDWESAHRSVQIGYGPESILRVAESANPGWTAEYQGQPLPAVVVDGWQQGWVVPAGGPGEIQLTYLPDRLQRAGMLAGVAAAGVAVLLGLWPVRRKAHAPGASVTRIPGVRLRWVVAGTFGGLTAGPAGLLVVAGVMVVGASLRPRPWQVLVPLAMVAAALVVAVGQWQPRPSDAATLTSLLVLGATTWPLAVWPQVRQVGVVPRPGAAAGASPVGR